LASTVKGPVQCFSQSVVMNQCFLQNKKSWRRFVLSPSRKT